MIIIVSCLSKRQIGKSELIIHARKKINLKYYTGTIEDYYFQISCFYGIVCKKFVIGNVNSSH